MRSAVTILLLFLTSSLMAGTGEDPYAISAIPTGLLKNANVVKRMENIRYIVTEGNKARYVRKVAYTILNEQGDRWAGYSESYDKLKSIESFEGSLYDASGKKIRSLKKAEISDISGNDDASLADDNRVKWHSFFYKVYPFTVEYEVEVRYKGTMFSPEWIPQQRGVMSVQQAILTVKTPISNPLRFRAFNYRGEPTITEEKNEKTYTWKVNELPAIQTEFASPNWYEITTSVFLATEKFVLEDYEGSNASWKDFGKFVYDLKKERDALPDDVKRTVHQLTDGLSSSQEKIRVLYEYMQQNTRYISVQLGIGGWQPYDAKYVAARKYGDCKALSNFMYSLLKEVGIRSVYTVTRRGYETDYLLTDLPSSQFNHVILLVPQGKDTTWLECTSQTYGTGYIGGDNGNRLAVAVDENGGALVRTPRYGINENLQIRNIRGTLDEKGDMNIKIITRYTGIQQDGLHSLINSIAKDKVKEYLQEELDFATYEINQFAYKQDHSILPAIDETLDITVNNYAHITGKRLFIQPNIMTRTNQKLNADSARKFDIVLGMEYRDIDSVTIAMPTGYKAELLPPDVSIKSKFGKFSSSVRLDNDQLSYFRIIEYYGGRFPSTDFNELVKFFEAIYKADRQKVVLVKKDQ